MRCPLCHAADSEGFYQDKHRSYYHCSQCDLMFVPAEQHLSAQEERACYDFHQNNSQDQGYLTFLSRLAEPLIGRLPPQQQGLDFGAGPGPALHVLLAAAGHQLSHYDPIYWPQDELLASVYDFVCSTEVVEHFCQPQASWALLMSLLKPKALLAIMTKRHLGREKFAAWHYKNDLTHVAFYSEQTLHYIAHHYQMKLELVAADVAIFQATEEN